MENEKRLLKKNDMVMVISGKERGKTGKLLKILPRTKRVIVEHANMVKHHQKPTQKQSQGGIIEKEGTISWSNVMVYCSRCAKPVRLGKKILADGNKIRYCKKCGESIEGK